MSDEKALTPKQSLFVEEYLKDLNGSRAAIRAGYSAKGANVTASKLLTIPNIATAVDKAKHARAEKAGITQEWVVNRLLQIAGTDMTELATWNESGVRFKESSELSAAAKASVQQIEQVMNEHGGGLKIKQYDRMSALKLLGQHLGMFKEQSEVKLTVDRPAEDLSDEELTRALESRLD